MPSTAPSRAIPSLLLAALILAGCAPAEVDLGGLDTGAGADALGDTGMTVVPHRGDCAGAVCSDVEDTATVQDTGWICWRLVGEPEVYEFAEVDAQGGCGDAWVGPWPVAEFIDEHGYSTCDLAAALTEHPTRCAQANCVPDKKDTRRLTQNPNQECTITKVLKCKPRDDG